MPWTERLKCIDYPYGNPYSLSLKPVGYVKTSEFVPDSP